MIGQMIPILSILLHRLTTSPSAVNPTPFITALRPIDSTTASAVEAICSDQNLWREQKVDLVRDMCEDLETTVRMVSHPFSPLLAHPPGAVVRSSSICDLVPSVLGGPHHPSLPPLDLFLLHRPTYTVSAPALPATLRDSSASNSLLPQSGLIARSVPRGRAAK